MKIENKTEKKNTSTNNETGRENHWHFQQIKKMFDVNFAFLQTCRWTIESTIEQCIAFIDVAVIQSDKLLWQSHLIACIW